MRHQHDEKPSPMRIEHEYSREMAEPTSPAWDAHGAKVVACCTQVGIAPADHFVVTVMNRKPYRNAKRILGSSTMP
jgi:hypothetical protein